MKSQAYGAEGINRQINFQGKLVSSPSGTNVSNTSYTVVFTIYDRDSGGTALWSETQNVTTTDGIFRVSLGSVTPFPANFNFNWSGLYLGIRVSAPISDPEMTPRIQLAAVPFAFNAQQVAGLTVQDTNGNASTSGTLQVGNTTTVNTGLNNLTFSTGTAGTGSLTINSSGTTSVTLPTSGTLSTLAGSEILTNKTIGSTGLTFSGATTDITTATNEDFILTPNGSGKVGFYIPSNGSTLASIDIRGNPVAGGTLSIASVSGTTSFAALTVDNNGVGDIFTASKSGLSLFTVKNNGQVKLDAPYYQSCTLTTDSAGLMTCFTGNIGTNWWNQVGGVVSPVNNTWDLVAGGSSTSSAAFHVFGSLFGGTMPAASVSANSSFAGLVANNNGIGDLFTASKSGLPLFTVKNNGQLTLGAPYYQSCTLITGTTGLITCGTNTGSFGWNQVGGVVSPAIRTWDFAVGYNPAITGNATNSALFSFTGVQTGLTVASISGQLIVMPNNGYGGNASISASLTLGAFQPSSIQTTNNRLLTIGGNTTGGIQFMPNNSSSSLYLATNGYTGIGTIVPLANLDIRGTSGIVGVASMSGNTSFASLVINNDGIGDIISASKSGFSLFTVKNNGFLKLGAPSYQTCTLTTDSTGLITCGSIFAATNLWNQAAGVVSPSIRTWDFAVGYNPAITGNATNSALFSFTGVQTGLTTASVSGQLVVMPNNGFGGNATIAGQLTVGSVNGASIQSVRNQLLTIGGNTSGNILFSPNNTSTLTLSPNIASLTGDLYVSGTTGITLSGNNAGIVFSGTGISQITTAANQHLSLNAGGFGLVGINTDGTTPLANFDVRANIGTLAVASVSGATSFASLVIDQSGVGDIITASSSGAPRLVLSRGGTLSLVGGQGADLDTLTNTTLKIGTSKATTITIGSVGNGITLPGFTQAGSVLTVNSSGNVVSTGTGGALQCLISQGTSTPGWAGCITGTSGFWTLDSPKGVMYPVNTTLDLLWGGTSSSAASFRLTGSAASGTSPVASISARTTAAALVVDNTVGDFITASSSGVTRFVIKQNGSVGIGGASGTDGYTLDVKGNARIGNNTTNDIFKDTTSDFTQGGSSITTVESSNTPTVNTSGDDITLVTDLIGAGATLTSPQNISAGTGQTIGAGAIAFQRPDSKFVVVAGGNSNATRLYDQTTAGFSASPNLPLTSGTGTTAFQRQNGKFLILMGGTNQTAIYDSAGSNNFGLMSKGPTLTGVVGAGSQVIRRSDGKFIVVLGNSSSVTNVYDPTAAPLPLGVPVVATDSGSFNIGPSLTSCNVQTGSFVFETIYGKWVVGCGNSTATNIYDPTAGSFSAGPVLTGSPVAGTFVIQRPDYTYLVAIGGSGSTQVYNPTSNSWTAGPTLPSLSFGVGAHAFQRSDGKWTIVVGGGRNETFYYDPTDTSGTGGGNAYGKFFTDVGLYTGYTATTGSLSFQRPDGKYIILSGGGTNVTIYDAGWNTTGTWTSEGIANAYISTYSAIMWQSNPQSANNNARLDQSTINVSVKTAGSTADLTNARWNSIGNSGDLIGGTSNPAGAVQIQVEFNAPIRSYPQLVTEYINQSNIWGGEGSTFNRRSLLQPTVFSIRVQNPLIQYGGLAADPQYGRNFATAGAQLEGVVTDNNNQLALAVTRNMPTATNSAGFIIASASANIGYSVGAGSFAFSLPTGQVVLGIGGTSNTITRIYDPDTNSFGVGPTLPAASGTGAHAFQLPNGNFFVILGGGLKNTAIYDIQANVFYSGPTLATAATTGSNTFQRPDGLFINIASGGTATNIIDPFLMTVTQGPYLTAAVATGSWNLRRPDGRILVFTANTATGLITNIYDAATNAFVVGPPPFAAANGAGGMAVQLSTGKVLWIRGNGGLTTSVLDPNSNTVVYAGPALTNQMNTGSFAIPRPDGKVLIGTANTAATTQVFDPYGTSTTVQGQFSLPANSPTLPCTLGVGSLVFQRPDGVYVLICGNSLNSVVIDAGWNLGGSYITEQIFEPLLSSTNALYWQNIGQGNIYVKYRTAADQQHLGVAAWKDLQYSGSNISVSTGDQWFQARFDFSGELADMPGAKSKIWPSSEGGGNTVYNRSVKTPIMSYWKLLNSQTPTLLTLTSGGSNAFRFSADGQAYTLAGGAWNSGGADLAERYSSSQTLEAGEVVIGDRLNPQNVIRSTDPYQTNIMGVVSTQPGFVAGSYTPDSYPIALVGRVPVKISTENGPIRSGDYLTSASIPGYAMKATVAGRVLGTALEDFDPVNATTCPTDGAGSLTTTQCGVITAFINLTDYQGENVEMLMADKGFTAPDTTGGIETESGLDSVMNTVAPKDYAVLTFLENLKAQGTVETTSAILTGTVNAINQIISPEIVAGIITAKTIRADRIEGLEIYTDKLVSLSSEMAVLAASTQSGTIFATNSGVINVSDLNVNGLVNISGDVNTKGNGVIEGMLTVLKSITSTNLLISDFASFFGDVLFRGNVKFEGRPTFNSDTAGFAVIKAGQTSISINFSNEYINTPVVTASIVLDKTNDTKTNTELEQAVLSGNLSYVITQRTTKGFVIKLNKPLEQDINFSWVSLSVANSKTQNSETGAPDASVTPGADATKSAAFQSVVNELNSK